MNLAPDLNNHLWSIGFFRSRKIDQKFSIFALTSAAVLLHSPARGKKTDDSYDENFDGEPVKSRKAGIRKILLPKKGPDQAIILCLQIYLDHIIEFNWSKDLDDTAVFVFVYIL